MHYDLPLCIIWLQLYQSVVRIIACSGVSGYDALSAGAQVPISGSYAQTQSSEDCIRPDGPRVCQWTLYAVLVPLLDLSTLSLLSAHYHTQHLSKLSFRMHMMLPFADFEEASQI